MMLCIPTLLINGLNHPRVYTIRGENALHIAARYGYYEICIYILEAIGSPLYVAWYQGGETSTTHEVTAKLLELFLNSPERVRYETPLHLAAQYGWECVVRVLISYPQCELKPNRSGLYPKDLICTRAPTSRSTPEIRSAIAELVRKNYYVPLIRTESDLEVPYVGEPFTRQKPPSLRHLSTSVLAPVQQMKAFAGPMTYRQALLFAKLWQNPARMSVVACQGDDTDRPGPSRLDLRFLCPASSRVYDKSNVSQSPGHIVRAFRRLNMRNAMERIGCFLAKAQNVKWKEYWSFLDVYCDLSEPDGLRRFEEYLANQATLLFEPSNNAQIAIGGNIRKIENLYAMHALTHVDIDEQQYPLLARWKKYMLFIMNT
uniref:ANKLE2 third alpha/beta domain-containing protein n=1 Tax=Anopheles minimus TaxID=112268 RepID=A0A182W5U8_9DIPT